MTDRTAWSFASLERRTHRILSSDYGNCSIPSLPLTRAQREVDIVIFTFRGPGFSIQPRAAAKKSWVAYSL